MAIPRGKVVKEGVEGVYHCMVRCVRRAFLCGTDKVTGRDYSHRKKWAVAWLRFLAGLFAVDVCAFAVMMDHLHAVLRTRPDVAEGWTDEEVAWRWLKACSIKGRGEEPSAEKVRAVAARPGLVAQLRKRLTSVSWFMALLDEAMARAANKEDGVTGRFWEGRFKCVALLDAGAIAACMAYVDLNPVRAGEAETPEESDFTSIGARIRAWQAEEDSPGRRALEEDGLPEMVSPAQTCGPSQREADWLCPIGPANGRRGILPLTEQEYWRLVDATGRIVRPGKAGSIDAELAPILVRLGLSPGPWPDTVRNFGRVSLAAGALDGLRQFARDVGQRWLHAFRFARLAFG